MRVRGLPSAKSRAEGPSSAVVTRMPRVAPSWSMVPYRSGQGVAVALDLDDELAAADGIGVHGADVDAAVAGPGGGHDLEAHGLEERRDQVLEVQRVHLH